MCNTLVFSGADSVDIMAATHLRSKKDLEHEFWDALPEIVTDIAKKDWQFSWKATDWEVDFWLRGPTCFSKVTEQLIGDHLNRNYE